MVSSHSGAECTRGGAAARAIARSTRAEYPPGPCSRPRRPAAHPRRPRPPPRPCRPSACPLAEALGRTLAEDLRRRRTLPPFAASTMDGYALRAADAPHARRAAAGGLRGLRRAGAAARPAPRGLLPDLHRRAASRGGRRGREAGGGRRRRGGGARFARAVPAGQFVRPPGSDLRAGAVALPAGALLDPPALGLAAALGHRELPVRRRPRVAILPTGDELVPPGRPRGPGQIRESNGPALRRPCARPGGEARLLAAARRPAGEPGAGAPRRPRGADVLLTVGGVSVGARDLVRGALRARRRPPRLLARGHPSREAPHLRSVGRHAGVRAARQPRQRAGHLRALRAPRAAGAGRGCRRRAAPRLGATGPGAGEAAGTSPCSCASASERAPAVPGFPWAEPLRTQQSGDLSSLLGADALAVLPAGRSRFRRGNVVMARFAPGAG